MVQSLVLSSPPPHLYLVPMTGAFCVILGLALSHFLTRMLALVSEQMEQMTAENPMQSANWKHLQGGKDSCCLGGATRNCRKEGRPKGRLLQKPTVKQGACPSGRGKVSFP